VLEAAKQEGGKVSVRLDESDLIHDIGRFGIRGTAEKWRIDLPDRPAL